MKKIGIGLLSLFFLGFGVSFATSSLETFQRAYDQKLITLSENLTTQDSITREEFAPILLRYLEHIAKKEYQAGSCKATDINNTNPHYLEALTTLCNYGILKGEAGKLYPLRKLTNGQAVVIIIRILHGHLPETTEGGKHRAEAYFVKAEQEGYAVSELKKIKNAPIRFENLIHFLYSTQHPHQKIEKTQIPQPENIQFKDSDEALKKLAEIMTQ